MALFKVQLYKLLLTTDFSSTPSTTMSTPEPEQSPTSTSSIPVELPFDLPLEKPTPDHPYRVYGYKVTRQWLWKFGEDHHLARPEMSKDSLESEVFGYLILRLPGLQRHFIYDPSDPVFGYNHILSLANNWNKKKLPLVAKRLPRWQSVLGTEEKPRWYMPTLDTVPRR